MTTGIQLLNIVWNQHYADYYPADEGLFNVSKITKEHRPSRLCSDVIFLTLRRFSRLIFNKNVAKLFKSFFAQDFLKKYIKDKTSVKGKISFYLLEYPSLKNEFCFTKNNLTCFTFQNSYFTKFPQRRPPSFSTSSFSRTEYNICFS